MSGLQQKVRIPTVRVPLVPLLLLTSCAGSLRGASETVAVLPFVHRDVVVFDWIGESFAETLRESLASQGVLVLNREDRVEVYRRLAVRPEAEIEALDAGQVIYGQYAVHPGLPGGTSVTGTLSVTARLLDLKHRKLGAEFKQSGAMSELSMLESRLAWQVLHELQPKSTPPQDAFLKANPPVRVDAMESYIRGLMARTNEQQIRLFTQAAHLDPRFSQPAFQLGRIHFNQKNYKEAGQWLERVTAPDSHFMEARYLLGICRFYAGDFEAAVNLFQEVAKDVPLNEVFNNLGAAQSRRDDPAAAGNFRKAVEGDEADPDYWFNLGYALWRQGDFKSAEASFRAVLARTPDDLEATILLGRCLRKEPPQNGDTKLARRERIKQTFEETAFRQLQAELKK
jgi:tetratricopeptide (TPR) repeat protein